MMERAKKVFGPEVVDFFVEFAKSVMPAELPEIFEENGTSPKSTEDNPWVPFIALPLFGEGETISFDVSICRTKRGYQVYLNFGHRAIAEDRRRHLEKITINMFGRGLFGVIPRVAAQFAEMLTAAEEEYEAEQFEFQERMRAAASPVPQPER